ncbi:sporulation protein [Streptomyces sp. NPDC050504]|uniref:sporulation protein n=1 Tax=Streptomyces sp. NPDC050504 TaxID=3365618 RepID=UPI0037B41CFF
MVFRKLFGWGKNDAADQDPPEIDTQISTVTLLPGREVEGEILLKGGGAGLKVNHLKLEVVAKALTYDGGSRERYVDRLSARRSSLEVAAGAEERIAFSGSLPWECPVTELAGRALGVDVSLTTKLDWESDSPVRDLDFLHIAAPPLYEAVLDEFAQEGYFVDGSQIVDSYIPDAEARRSLHQIFFLGDPARGPEQFGELEVVFHQNVLGATVHVRRAARAEHSWSNKPPTRVFQAAHHEVGEADFGERVRATLTAITLMGR